MPADASRLYARNVTNLLALMIADRRASSAAATGTTRSLAGACVTRDGAIRHEPTRELPGGDA